MIYLVAERYPPFQQPGGARREIYDNAFIYFTSRRYLKQLPSLLKIIKVSMCCFRIGTSKGWKKFKPRPQNRNTILVPFWVFSKFPTSTPVYFILESPRVMTLIQVIKTVQKRTFAKDLAMNEVAGLALWFLRSCFSSWFQFFLL